MQHKTGHQNKKINKNIRKSTKPITLFLTFMLIISVLLPIACSTKGNQTWSTTLTINEPGGAFDTVIFSEAPDANDGSPADSYDLPKPIPPMPPYIRAWFSDGLTQPYDQLWEDCRIFPDTSKNWSLSIQWFPQDYVTPTTITLNWDTTTLAQSEYNSIELFQDTTSVADMITQTSYSFAAPALALTTFSIKCTTIGNQPPTAINDADSTLEDTDVDINVSANDYDIDGTLDYNSIDIILPATHGTTTIQPNSGIITYNPDTGYYGQDSFTYTIDDNDGDTSNQAQVNITINHINQPPVVSYIPDQTIDEGTSFLQIHLDNYVEDSEDPDSSIQWTISGNTDLSVSLINRVATITPPNSDWNGAETLTFLAEDTNGGTDQDTATFTITPINDAPIVSDIPDQIIAEGQSFTQISLDNYVEDIDNDDNEIEWTTNGQTDLIISINIDRIATITVPNPNWTGAETITFTAEDPGQLSDTNDATFTVTDTNDPPVVSNIPDQTILEGQTFTQINLDDYVEDPEDPDEDISWTYSGNIELTITISNRIATITIPHQDWHGIESITFTATDTTQLSDYDTASFEVIPQNDPPTTTNDIYNVDENSQNNILPVLINDYDIDGDPIHITSVSTPTHGTATHNGQTITYTPTPGYTGTDSFTYTIADDNGSADITGNVDVIILTNQPPNTPTTPQGPTSGYTSTSYTFTTSTTDPENQDLTYGWDLNNDDIIDQTTGPYTSGNTASLTTSWSNIGTYQIKVKAIDTLNKESLWSQNLTITIKKKTSSGGGGGGPIPAPNLAPTAEAIIEYPNGNYINTDIIINASTSYDTDGTITEWNWNLNDGTEKTGEIITHQYTEPGTYIILLTVIDNYGLSDTDQITLEITKPNTPPQNIKLTGPTITSKLQPTIYTIQAHDQENDLIQYIINWGDNTTSTTPLTQSGQPQNLNHSWTTPGHYNILVTAQDNKNTPHSISSPLEQLILVDVWDINDIITGYLLDTDSDGIYDNFHNNELLIYTSTEILPNGSYLIDADGNTTWDYIYNIETNTLSSYIVSTQTETFPLMIISILGFILLFLAILMINILRHRHNQTKNQAKKTPNKKTKTSVKNKK